MDNQELLVAISDMMDRKIEPLRNDICELKEDVSGLKQQVQALEKNVGVLNIETATLKSSVQKLEGEMREVKGSVRRLELLHENEVLPRLQVIESCYVGTYQRYSEGIVDIDSMKMDISTMKAVLVEHSAKLQRIS